MFTPRDAKGTRCCMRYRGFQPACTFVFKVTAKYYPPDFVAHVLPRIPSNASVVLQQSRYFGQGCEIFGAPREALLTQLGEEEWEASFTP